MRRRLGVRLAVLVALASVPAACARPPGSRCAAREVALANGSPLAVEQLYLGTGAAGGWGPDLLAGRGPLAPGERLPIRVSGAPDSRALRAVWVNGRAVEALELDGCTIGRVIVTAEGLLFGG